MPDWFRRRPSSPPAGEDAEQRRGRHAATSAAVPAGLFVKCDKCGHLLPTKEFERDLRVCARCGHHHKLTADERIAAIADADSFRELNAHLRSEDALAFPDYAAKLEKGEQASGRKDGLVTGTARIGGYGCVLGVVDFRFMGGSMGSVFGEKFVRAAEHALARKLPFVVFCASGGARMQEGLLGLMQMAKTSAAVARLCEAGVPYLVVLTDPTTGGAFASFASLGDVILAEPGAHLAFAGARVAQQAAQTHKPPANYQTSEFQEERGMVDRVVPRKELPATLTRVLAFFPTSEPSSPNGEAALNGTTSAAAAATAGARNGKGQAN